MLTFDEPTHTYRWSGAVVPGTTAVLAPLTTYDRVPRHLLDKAAAFGKAAHRACELDDLGTLDEEALDPALRPYLLAWRRFSADHLVEWEQIERPLYHPTFRYAGTPDRGGRVLGQRAVVDIKTTVELYASVGPQTAAYAQLLDPVKGTELQRYGVQLRGDGTYHAELFTDRSDWAVFASLLTLRTWCQRHSITPHFKAQP